MGCNYQKMSGPCRAGVHIHHLFNDDELQYGDTLKQVKIRDLLDIVEIIRGHIPIVQTLK